MTHHKDMRLVAVNKATLSVNDSLFPFTRMKMHTCLLNYTVIFDLFFIFSNMYKGHDYQKLMLLRK